MDYARLTPGAGFRPWQAVGYYGQRLLAYPPVRTMAAGLIRRHIRSAHPDGISPPQTGSAAAATAAALTEDGLARLPNLLPQAGIDEMLAFLQARHPDGDWPPGGHNGAGEIAYPLDAVLRCPHVLDLANHPTVLAAAAAVIGCKPTISSIGIRWSLPNAGRVADTQSFHRDLDDWRAIKLFVYLTDVEPGTGPFTIVAGSHRTPLPLRARRYHIGDIAADFGMEAVRTVTGPRGTCFMADVHGIHRGEPPRTGPRLMLQIQYSLLPVFAFRYRPLALPDQGHRDPYVNRLLLAPSR